MIEKKFLKTGNSWCVVIPSDVIKILGINPEKDNIQLSLEDGNILIKPIKSK
jgi:antitoxin component of MazEF toxin-antitoxin module